MQSMTFYDKVNQLCRQRGTSITAMADKLNISRSTPSDWKNKGAQPQAGTLKAVADFLEVSMDVLLDEDALPEAAFVYQNNGANYGMIGEANAPVKIINGTERYLTDHETELLRIFAELSAVEQSKVLIYAAEMKEK